MTPEEVSASIDAYFDEYKDRWERLRSSNHAVISSQSSKPIKATDVMEFVWDKESQMNGKGQLSKEDVEKIKQDLKDKFNLK